jgi:hypothetical protein
VKRSAQAPPQTSPGPRRAPPPARAIHTQRCSQPKPDTRVTRDLAPPVKGGYIPIGRPKQLPEGGVNSPLSPPPKGGGLPQAQTKREEGDERQAARSQMGVIRPAQSPHPGSHATVEGANAQKDGFTSINLESDGMVSNAVTGFGRVRRRHAYRAWPLVSRGPYRPR